MLTPELYGKQNQFDLAVNRGRSGISPVFLALVGGNTTLNDKPVATVQTLVYRLAEKGALRKVKKIGNAQLFQAVIDQKQYRSGLVRDLLDLFGGSPRLLVSLLLISPASRCRHQMPAS